MMGKRDAPHFITEYYTERGKVELMIPADATDDDFALLRDMLDLIEAKMKRRADRKTENCSEKPNNCEGESQTERIKTLDYCDICNHKGCENCIANNLDDYCVPSGYEPITKTKTQNLNLTFEKRTMRDCYNCKRFETEDECIECHYEPKDEPQTERSE